MAVPTPTGTDFAPALRLDEPGILEQFNELVGEGRITEILDTAPYVAIVTNDTRQIIYANTVLRDMLDLDMEGIRRLRPGELLACPNAHENPGGCGTSSKCRFCGVVHVLLEAMGSDRQVQRDARMFISRDGRLVPFDVKVTATPITITGDRFLMVFMEDISNVKKRERLERTFFHDVMNTAGGMKNLAMFIAETGGDAAKKAAALLVDQSNLLIDEIKSQRLLVDAESDNLAVSPLPTSALELFTEARTSAEVLKVAEDRSIVSRVPEGDRRMVIDSVLAKRALLNLLKNALEATSKGGSITFSMDWSDDGVIFNVENDAVMSTEVKSQVFQRSFSTKGPGRGIGTYSMRLIVENYLEGRVTFVSQEGIGTRFTVVLPPGRD